MVKVTWHNVLLDGSVWALRRGHWREATVFARGRFACRVRFVDTGKLAKRRYEELAGRCIAQHGADKPADDSAETPLSTWPARQAGSRSYSRRPLGKHRLIALKLNDRHGGAETTSGHLVNRGNLKDAGIAIIVGLALAALLFMVKSAHAQSSAAMGLIEQGVSTAQSVMTQHEAMSMQEQAMRQQQTAQQAAQTPPYEPCHSGYRHQIITHADGQKTFGQMRASEAIGPTMNMETLKYLGAAARSVLALVGGVTVLGLIALAAVVHGIKPGAHNSQWFFNQACPHVNGTWAYTAAHHSQYRDDFLDLCAKEMKDRK